MRLKRFISFVMVCIMIFASIPISMASTKSEAHVDVEKLFKDVEVGEMKIKKNNGQLDKNVAFYFSNENSNTFITDKGEIVYDFYNIYEIDDEETQEKIKKKKGSVISEKLNGANISTITALNVETTNVNFFYGKEQSEWIYGLEETNHIAFGEVYENIQLDFRVNGETLEKIFTVSPGGSPDDIEFQIKGSDEIYVDENGNLVILDGEEQVSFSKPYAYQIIEGKEVEINASYSLKDKKYGYSIGKYNNEYPLIIDPVAISSYFGSGSYNNVVSEDIATDSQGNIYVTGYTDNPNYPTTTGVYDETYNDDKDIFVSKFTPDMATLIASTFIGGTSNKDDIAYDIEIVNGNEVLLTGQTESSDFPVTTGAYDETLNGAFDIFLLKLDDDLTTINVSTFYGGPAYDYAYSMVVHENEIYVAGAAGFGIPMPANAYQNSNPSGTDALIVKFDMNLSNVLAATYIGDSYTSSMAYDIELNRANDIYITGYSASRGYPTTAYAYDDTHGGSSLGDVIVSKLDNGLTTMLASTFIGDSGNDYGHSIDITSDGTVYVVGETTSAAFPITQGAYQTSFGTNTSGFISKLSGDLSRLEKGTFLSGSNSIKVYEIQIDSAGYINIAGRVDATDFEVTQDAFDSTPLYSGEAFFTRMDSDLTTFLESTYLGGNGKEECFGMYMDESENIFLTGYSRALDFPTTSGVYSTSGPGGYVVKIERPLIGSGAVPYMVANGPKELKGQESGEVVKNLGAYKTDFDLITVFGAIPLTFNIEHHSLILESGYLGNGWQHNYLMEIESESESGATLKLNDNEIVEFQKDSTGKITGIQEEYFGVEFIDNGDGTFTIKTRDNDKYHFTSDYLLSSFENKHGQSVNISRDANNRVEYITDQITGKYLKLSYDTNNRISTISDNSATRTITLAYDVDNNLTMITDLNGEEWRFDYSSDNKITKLRDPELSQVYEITYDSDGLVSTIDDGRSDNLLRTFTYDLDTYPGDIFVTETNRVGDSTKSLYSANGMLLQEIDEKDYITSYIYNEYSQKIGMVDARGNDRHYTYYSDGSLEKIEEPSIGSGTKETIFGYTDGDLTLITDDKGNQTVYNYSNDGKHNLLSETNAEGHVTSYTYNTDSQVATMTTPMGSMSEYTYLNGMLDVLSVDGDETSYQYYDTGLVLKVIDPRLNETTYTYDNRGAVLTEKNDLLESITNTYYSNGLLHTITDRNNNTTTYDYDGNGNLTKVNNSKNENIFSTYDGEDRLLTVKNENYNPIVYTYDERGLVVSKQDQNGNTLDFEYDELGNLIKEFDAYDNWIKTYEYDERNNVHKIKDAYQVETIMEYDDLDLMTSMTDRENNMYQYAYNDIGDLEIVTDPALSTSSQILDIPNKTFTQTDNNGNQMILDYNAKAQVVKRKFTTTDYIQYDYNSVGLLSSMTNARNNQFAYDYDSLNRLSTEQLGSEITTYGYDDNSNLETITNSQGTITRVYDELNRVTSFTDVNSNTIGFTYDDRGNVETITYPGNKVVTYTYDQGNRLTSVKDWNNDTTSYEYYDTNQLKKITRPNGTAVTYTYDLNGYLETQVDEDVGGTDIYNVSLSQNYEGHVESETYADYTTTNTLDVLYQLDQSVEKDSQQVTLNDFDYAYDDGGNVESIVENTQSNLITYTSDNRINTFDGQTVTYDADGNMTYGPLDGVMTNFAYDERNRLTSVGNFTYEYDAEGNRISIVEGSDTTDFVNMPGSLFSTIMKTDSQGNTAYYIYGNGLVSEITDTGTSYYHYDYKGNTIALTDGNGSTTDTFKYSPFGDVIARTGTYEPLFQFSGKYGIIKDETSMYYMRARYYNTDIQRFISRDTYEGMLSTPLTLNNYAYGLNNPFSYVDPSGQSVWDMIAGLTYAVDEDFYFSLAQFIVGDSSTAHMHNKDFRDVYYTTKITGKVYAILSAKGLLQEFTEQGGKILVTSTGDLVLEGSPSICADQVKNAIKSFTILFSKIPNGSSGTSNLRPEAGYLKGKKHGLKWKEGPARAKNTGNPQGQWGSMDDLNYAGEKAGTLNPGEGAWFDLPEGSSSVVHMPDGTTVDATRIWVRNNGTGTFHGYPAP